MSGPLPAAVRLAAAAPILRCLMHDRLGALGTGAVLLARTAVPGRAVAATFRVDLRCLGVTDAAVRELGLGALRSLIAELGAARPMVPAAPAQARKLVRAAAAYGASLGFAAPAGLAGADALFGAVDADAWPEPIVCGSDGLPLYAPDPDTPPERVRAVAAQLRRRLGPDGFRLALPASAHQFGQDGSP